MVKKFTKNQILVSVIAVVAGVAAGIGGYFLHKKHAEKQALMTIGVEEDLDRVNRRREARAEARKPPEKGPKGDPGEVVRYPVGGSPEVVEARFAEAESPHEDEFWVPEVDDIVPEEKEPEKLPAQKRIHTIEKDEFDNDEEYDKIYLTFYEGDGIISDERDEIVENWRELIGKEAPEEMEIYDTIAEMYIRNEKRHTDFALVKALGEYPYKEDLDE